MSPSNTAEALLEVPSLLESAVASRKALDPTDLLSRAESAELRELSGPSAEESAIETALDEEMTAHLGEKVGSRAFSKGLAEAVFAQDWPT